MRGLSCLPLLLQVNAVTERHDKFPVLILILGVGSLLYKRKEIRRVD